jgi:hypothetical protein
MSRLQIGSAKTFLCFGYFVVALGLLVDLDKGSGFIDRALQLTWLIFLVIGSALLSVRM